MPFISYLDYCNVANEYRLYFDQRVALSAGNGDNGRFGDVVMVKFYDSWSLNRNQGNSDENGRGTSIYTVVQFQTLDQNSGADGSVLMRVEVDNANSKL